MTNGIIAVEGDAKLAGAITYWQLNGTVSLDALRTAWVAAGLDEDALPSEPSETVGLSRAVRALLNPERDAHKIKGGEFKGGWVITETDTTGAKPVTVNVLTAAHTADEDAARSADNLRISVEPGFEFHRNEPTGIVLRKAYNRARGELDPSGDVSPWLKRLADALGCVSLRDTGGVYFIPRDGIDAWRKYAEVVESVSQGSHRIHRIPAMQTDDAVAAILDAIETEAESTLEAFEADLCKDGDDKLGLRALKSRSKQAEALADKLAKYEALLGVKLNKIRESLENTQANLTAAEWAIEAEKDKANDDRNVA